MVQGRFLFAKVAAEMFNGYCLNPFGSGTFFIQEVQLCYLKQSQVLIPLVQGRFLFFLSGIFKELKMSLNPFGSGTFFIP